MTDSKNKDKIEDLIEQMIGNLAESESTSAPDVVTIEEGESVTCPDCGSSSMIEGFVESENSDEAMLAYACADCDTKLVSETPYNFNESEVEEIYEAEIDEENPHCPVCESAITDITLRESEGKKDIILDCGNCGASMEVVG